MAAKKKEIRLSEKELAKVQDYSKRMGELRNLFAQQQAGLNDILEMIDDRYEIDLKGGTHVLQEGGVVVEAELPKED